MNYPIVSVILPFFNAESTLSDAIESILRQTVSDIEVILINDGSSDLSGCVARRWVHLDRRIVYIERANRGLTPTLNEGIRRASGRFIARMDADDISHHRRLELQLKALEEAGADMCGSHIRCFGLSRNRRTFPLSQGGIEISMLFGNPVAHPSVIGKADLFKSYMYDEEFDCAEDMELWQRMVMAGVRFINANATLVKYRTSENQISTLKRDRQIDFTIEVCKRHASNLLSASEFRVWLELINSLYNRGPLSNKSIDLILQLWSQASTRDVKDVIARIGTRAIFRHRRFNQIPLAFAPDLLRVAMSFARERLPF